MLGQDHPQVADSKFNIALVYKMRNEIDTARELFLECEKIYSKVHGTAHSSTADAALEAGQCVQESV